MARRPLLPRRPSDAFCKSEDRSNLRRVADQLRLNLSVTSAGGNGGASVVGLDYDATAALPVYDWMGVPKAVLEFLPQCVRLVRRSQGVPGALQDLFPMTTCEPRRARLPLHAVVFVVVGPQDVLETPMTMIRGTGAF